MHAQSRDEIILQIIGFSTFISIKTWLRRNLEVKRTSYSPMCPIRKRQRNSIDLRKSNEALFPMIPPNKQVPILLHTQRSRTFQCLNGSSNSTSKREEKKRKTKKMRATQEMSSSHRRHRQPPFFLCCALKLHQTIRS